MPRFIPRFSSPLGSRELDLDVVRGTAILLAMGWHLGGPSVSNPVTWVLFWPGRTFGWAGVDLFFVLSGFLVGRLIFLEERRTGSFRRGRFLLRRILKLWPVFYVFLIAQLIFGDNPPETFFLQNLLHVQNYWPSSHAHLWSLAVEEHFYLLVALLLPLCISWSNKRMLWVIGVVMAVPLFLRIGAVIIGADPVAIQTLTHFRVDALAAGTLLAFLSVRMADVFAALLRQRWLWGGVTAIVVVWLSLFEKQSALGSSVGYTLTWIGGAAFMLLLYKSPVIPAVAPWVRWIGLLGIYSYSLYIWHIAAARLTEQVMGKVAPGLLDQPLVVLVATYAGAIAVAIVMTRLVEWPMLRIRNKVFPSKTDAVDVPADSDARTIPEPAAPQAAERPQ